MENKVLLAGLIISIIGLIVICFFNNTMSCSNSCIGCSSVIEWVIDDINYFIGLIMLLLGVFIMFIDIATGE